MSNITIIGIRYELIDCAGCGIGIVAPEDFIDRRRKDGKSFFCPSGCRNFYGNNTEKRLRETILDKERLLATERENSQRMSRKVLELEKKLNKPKRKYTKRKKAI